MKKLELIFENELGKSVVISLDQPVEPLDVNAVNAVMDEVVAQNIFTTNGGDIVGKKSARIVERNVTELELGF